MSDEEPQIVEMREDDWISPEEQRLIDAERAREREELRRAQAEAGVHASPAHNIRAWPGLQASTVLSDLFLALVAVYCAYAVRLEDSFVSRGYKLMAAAGFLIIALAAFAGSVRFSGLGSRWATPAHDLLSRMAAVLGLPCVAIAALYAGERVLDPQRLQQIFPFFVFLCGVVFRREWDLHVAPILPVAAVGLIGFKAVAVAVSFGSVALVPSALWMGGVLLTLAAGEALKRRNQFLGSKWLLGVDVFHYFFALALLCFCFALRNMSSLGALRSILLRYVL